MLRSGKFGIESYEDLTDAGSIAALIRIKGKSGKGCHNMLYALEGAVQGLGRFIIIGHGEYLELLKGTSDDSVLIRNCINRLLPE